MTDENINAPNYQFNIGTDNPVKIVEGAVQEDETSQKNLTELQTRDEDQVITFEFLVPCGQ